MRPRRFGPGARDLRALLALVVSTLLVGACVAPAFDSGAFHRNAIQALDSAVSVTRTAAVVVDNHLAGRVLRPYADTVVTDSEDALGPVQDSFGTVDPPTASDARLRDDVDGLLSDAGNALAKVRIALRRGDSAAMRQRIVDLTSVADRMEQASERLS